MVLLGPISKIFFLKKYTNDMYIESIFDGDYESAITLCRIYMSEERAHCTVREKNSIKINFMIGKN